jgi:DNA-directed RNA polymerase sigma subunit (sigma70/sigma32)
MNDELTELDGVELDEDESEEMDEESTESDASDDESDDTEAKSDFSDHSDDAIKLYLKEIQKTTLLTAEDERELAKRISEGRYGRP